MYDSTYLWKNYSMLEKKNRIVVASGESGQGMTEKGFEGTFWSVDNALYHDTGLGNICQHSSNGTHKVCAFH